MIYLYRFIQFYSDRCMTVNKIGIIKSKNIYPNFNSLENFKVS